MTRKKLVKDSKLIGGTRSSQRRTKPEPKNEFEWAKERAEYSYRKGVTARPEIKTIIRPQTQSKYGEDTRNRPTEAYYLDRAEKIFQVLNHAGDVDYIDVAYSSNGMWADVTAVVKPKYGEPLDVYKLVRIVSGGRGDNYIRYSTQFSIWPNTDGKIRIRMKMEPESYQEMSKIHESGKSITWDEEVRRIREEMDRGFA